MRLRRSVFFPVLYIVVQSTPPPHPPSVDIPISIELFKKKQGSQINTEWIRLS